MGLDFVGVDPGAGWLHCGAGQVRDGKRGGQR